MQFERAGYGLCAEQVERNSISLKRYKRISTNMVSIVLPTYNGEKFIRESIESIINQIYKDWELIVIDDCSIDSTNCIVSEYAKMDRRIRLFRNPQNLKLPASLNVGFEKTRGDYLTWSSDDNRYKPNAIKEMLDILQGDKDCGLVFSRMEIIDENGAIKGLSYEPIDVKELHYHNIVGASFLYTRKVYNEIGDYDTKKFLLEDYDYWLRIMHMYGIKYYPKILYQYRQHGSSLTETKNRQVLEGKIKLLEEQLQLSYLDSEVLRNIYKELAEASFSLDRYVQMKKYLCQMKAISPNMKDVRKAVQISYRIGPTMSSIIKKIMGK